MRPEEIVGLGVPRGAPLEAAVAAAKTAARDWKLKKGTIREAIRRVVKDPAGNRHDEIFGSLAEAIIVLKRAFVPRTEPAPYRQWGSDIEPGTVTQMENACALPVSVKGALMPDAHVGYGLPIGGVLATQDTVIPYAVGMDIACRMKLSVLDMPLSALERKRSQLEKVLADETRFGVGSEFKAKRHHSVMDADWSVSPVTRQHKTRAWRQLGTSGSGNHFVEFGAFTLEKPDLGLPPGTYLALLSHSGSRGVGGAVATHYSKLAMVLQKALPKELMHLAWLPLNSEAGHEYWRAMTLMGEYAKANHALIHRSVTAGLDEVPMAYKDIEGVMAAQADLVETVARFDPKLVKMAPAGERPED